MITRETILSQLEQERICLYTFFSRLFTDQTRFEDLALYSAHLEPVKGSLAGLAAEIRAVLEEWAGSANADLELRTEYARLMIMPNGVKPYESVYIGGEGLLMRESWLQVKEFYRRNGLVLDKPSLHPEDHAAVELAFMANLIESGADPEEQKLFFESHLGQWVPGLLKDIKKHCDARFYAEMASSGLEFLELEQSYYLTMPDAAEAESE